MMAPMALRIAFLDLSKNLIVHLMETILKNTQSCDMWACTSKGPHVNGGLACVRAA